MIGILRMTAALALAGLAAGCGQEQSTEVSLSPEAVSDESGPAVVVSGDEALNATLTGDWTGVGLQTATNEPFTTLGLDLHFNADGSGQFQYPAQECSGMLTRLRVVGEAAEFREEMTQGECVNGGTIGVIPKGDALVWYWVGEGTTSPNGLDVGVLRRAPAATP